MVQDIEQAKISLRSEDFFANQQRVLTDVLAERDRQDKKWGEQNHDPFVWLSILGEEFGEACKAGLEWWFGNKPLPDYRKEMVETAAVAMAALECYFRFAAQPRVYLAGPIIGCTDDETYDWREEAERLLVLPVLSPPEERDYREKLADDCMKQIVEPDKLDIMRSSIILANCWQPSVGTSMEILFAWERRKPIVTIVPDDKPLSAWIVAHSSKVCSTLFEATEAINKVFAPQEAQ